MCFERKNNREIENYIETLAKKVAEERKEFIEALRKKDMKIKALEEETDLKERKRSQMLEDKVEEFKLIKEQIIKDKDIEYEEEKKELILKLSMAQAENRDMENRLREKEKRRKQQEFIHNRAFEQLREKFKETNDSMKSDLQDNCIKKRNFTREIIILKARIKSEIERHEEEIQDIKYKIKKEALDELESDNVLKESLGQDTYDIFCRAKRAEVDEYRTRVTDWELERYLETA